MPGPTLVVFGEKSFPVSLLKLGAAKGIRPELLAVMSMRKNTEQLPTDEQIDAMITVVFTAAQLVDPTVTRVAIAAAVEDMQYLDGIAAISKAATSLIAPGARASTGEAASPAISSTSSGSTASSSPEPDGPTEPLTT